MLIFSLDFFSSPLKHSTGMWCAQSFKTLEEMTRHMRVTQHYTNIISQEQIISWRTPEDKLAQAQVNAVLTCKVCDEAFGSLKELSYHMVKNAHYKEHILRSITEGGHGRRKQTRERRKKSLPVRKLLELERMSEVSPATSSRDHKDAASSSSKSPVDFKAAKESRHSSTSSSVITCDECGSKVETKHLIHHFKSCKRSTSPTAAGTRSPSVASSEEGSSDTRDINATPSPSLEKKIKVEKSESEETPNKEQEKDEKEKTTESKTTPAASSACLSALQSLIDKSFDVKLPSIPPTTPSSRGSHHNNNNNIPSSSSHSEHHSRTKLNGHHHRSQSKDQSSRHSLCKTQVSSSLSAVEKWMTLAKEREAPHSHLWSPSVSSDASSWLCSEDEEAEGVALKANKAAVEQPVPSPSSIGTTSRPGSAPRAQTPSPVESNEATVVKSSSKNKRTSKARDCPNEEDKDTRLSSTKNEEEERREEIEALKRSGAPPMTTGRVETASSGSASLSALEKLIESSFDSKKKNTPTGFLQRLGIDEEVCPPWQPGLGLGSLALGLGAAGLPFGHPFQPWLIPKHGGRSSSSSPSKGTKNGSVSSSPPV
jgi:hypothetical protein